MQQCNVYVEVSDYYLGMLSGRLCICPTMPSPAWVPLNQQNTQSYDAETLALGLGWLHVGTWKNTPINDVMMQMRKKANAISAPREMPLTPEVSLEIKKQTRPTQAEKYVEKKKKRKRMK